MSFQITEEVEILYPLPLTFQLFEKMVVLTRVTNANENTTAKTFEAAFEFFDIGIMDLEVSVDPVYEFSSTLKRAEIKDQAMRNKLPQATIISFEEGSLEGKLQVICVVSVPGRRTQTQTVIDYQDVPVSVYVTLLKDALVEIRYWN